MEHNDQFLGTARIGALMRRYAVPCIISLLVGALYNIVDQIFIASASYLGSYGNAANTVVFLLRWGMMGAAVATVIGQAVTVALSLWYLLRMRRIRPARGDYALRGTVRRRTLLLGATSLLSQLSLVAAMAAVNNMLRKYGARDEVFSQNRFAQGIFGGRLPFCLESNSVILTGQNAARVVS